MSKVSVIVKSPESTGHLDTFLENLYAQTLKEWECYIIDGTLHAQKHCGGKGIDVIFTEGRDIEDVAVETALEIQEEKGKEYPILITYDKDTWHDRVLEDALEDLAQ